EKNHAISGELDKTATIIDHFFTGRVITKEENETNLVITNYIDWLDSSNIKYKPRIDLNLHLPNLEKKWKLHFTSYDEDSQSRGINKNRLKTSAPRERYGASVVLLEKIGKVNVTFRPKLEIKSTVTTSFLLRFERKKDLGKIIFKPRLEFFGKADTGTGQFVAINWDIPLNDIFTLFFINEEQYENTNHLLSVTHGLGISHPYNDSMSQTYGLNFEYGRRPAYHLERYTFASSFRHQWYRDVLHYSFTPYVVWDEEKRFSGTFGINVLIHFIF
ncbi:MAG: hypothetical protein KDD37_01600, partial [Bdellovibrionales bacterium]|nr:hypothetical protein [Bdellovibrionales bacterium]